MPDFPERKVYRFADYDSIVDAINSSGNKETLSFENPFVLLCGPSSVGKSTIIKKLNELTDNKFGYVTPYTTRPLREGETDKIHIDDGEFARMEEDNAFVFVNPLYGVKYGTPRAVIENILESERIPILDFPLEDVEKLQADGLDLLPIYVFPENIQSWYEQVVSVGRNTLSRLRQGLVELKPFLNSVVEQVPGIDKIKFGVINREGQVDQAAKEIAGFMKESGIL